MTEGPSAGEVSAGRAVSPVEVRIARVERALDVLALAAGFTIAVGFPAARVAILWPTLLVAAGLALLGTGLLRDLAWLALAGRPVAARVEGPREVRLCLESTVGALAIVGGVVWRWLAPGGPQPLGLGLLIFVLALVATVGQLARNVIVTLRLDPSHRNLPFWS